MTGTELSNLKGRMDDLEAEMRKLKRRTRTFAEEILAKIDEMTRLLRKMAGEPEDPDKPKD